ncbi:MAG: hypothetical protein C0434_07900 [Xanthomonadaceae bacterium]|nr:hypothetical protein [Xanthomonadaceae bacterium]
MTREYNLNTKQARSAEASRIDSTGAYTGSITQAFAIRSSKGSDGIELSFKADNGSTADYLSLYTHNAKGEELRGLKVLNSLMAVLKLRELKPARGKIKTRVDGQLVDAEGDVFPSLCARVGLVLQREEYVKNDGSLGSRMALFLPFCAETKRVASEILDQKPQGEALHKIVGNLKDRPAQAPKARTAQPTAGGGTSTGDFEDDDIPF